MASASARSTAARDPPGSRSRPNILLVVVDDLGWGEVGAYGQRGASGRRCSTRSPRRECASPRPYATPTCAPTRASLFTGLHTGHARVKSNADAGRRPARRGRDGGRGASRATPATGPGSSGSGGSATSGFRPSVPTRQGFDYFYGYLDQTHAHNYYPTFLLRNEERVEYPENAGADTDVRG